MDTRYYEYIITIAETGSITKAADLLYISQPTLSKFLKNLEEKNKTKIFRKVNGKFIPTVAGELYVKYGTKILEQEKELHENIIDVANLKNGILSLSITPTRDLYMLPILLPEFRKIYPNFSLNILEEGIDKIESSILEKKSKLGIYIADDMNKALNYEILQEEEVVICVEQGSKYIQLSEKREGFKFPWVDLRYMKDELFIISNPSTAKLGKLAQIYFKEYDINPKTVVIKNMETRLSLAAIGEGVAFSYDIGDRFFNHRAKPVFLSVGKVRRFNNFVISYLKNSTLDKPHADFIEITKEFFR